MSFDYLEDLSRKIDNGLDVYACPGQQTNQWFLGHSVDELRTQAQRTANARKFQTPIYRLVNKMDAGADDSYLIVRKILAPGPRGEPHFQWSLVDTREAAELMRDVSEGPTPYFGALSEEVLDPK